MSEVGLIGYQGLRSRLAVDGKLPCLRTVKTLVAKNRAVLRPIVLGHRSVGFQPHRVAAFLEKLEETRNGKSEVGRARV